MYACIVTYIPFLKEILHNFSKFWGGGEIAIEALKYTIELHQLYSLHVAIALIIHAYTREICMLCQFYTIILSYSPLLCGC